MVCKKSVLIGIFGLFLLLINLGFVAAFSGSGAGTLASPYVITNCTQLQEMNQSLSSNYSLGNNVNCSATKTWNGGQGFMPIGRNEGAPVDRFAGTLDGLGNNISGLYINLPSSYYASLLGRTLGDVSVEGVGLIDVNITGLNYVGGLVGLFSGNYVNNSFVTGTLVSSGACGGLIGYIQVAMNITNSYSRANVIGGYAVGGLGGYILGIVNNSYATGNVSASAENSGGLIGTFGGVLTNSYATGSVTGTRNVGGLWGDGSGVVSNSYATGNVNGTKYVGGLIGDFLGGSITNSYSMGNVTGTENVIGGLVGYAAGNINNSYATGRVNGSTQVGGLGGFIESSGNITNSYTTGKVYGTTQVGAVAGVFGGYINNTYWYNNTDDDAIACIATPPGNSCDTNMISSLTNSFSDRQINIFVNKLSSSINYFKGDVYPFREPMASWNFYDSWTERDGDYPALTWQEVGGSVLDYGTLNSSVSVPTSGAGVNNRSTFSFSSNVTCTLNDCGNVSAYLDPIYNRVEVVAQSKTGLSFYDWIIKALKSITGYAVSSGVVSTSAGDTPFFTTSANPQNCSNMKIDDSCTFNWTVNATGEAGVYEFFVFYNSSNETVSMVNSSFVNVTINVEPLVKINSPIATTYTTSSVYVNIGLNKEGYCFYSLNSGASNSSLTANSSNSGFTGTMYDLGNGGYSLKAYCNDSYGLKNYSESVSFLVDSAGAGAESISSGGGGASPSVPIVPVAETPAEESVVPEPTAPESTPPSESPEECNSDLICGDWGECIFGVQSGESIFDGSVVYAGTRSRICRDRNNCITDRIETETCTVTKKTEVTKEEIEGVEMVVVETEFGEVIGAGGEGGKVSVTKSSAYINNEKWEKNGTLGIVFSEEVSLVPIGCFNGIEDGDETGIDCGGSCKECKKSSTPFLVNWAWWALFVLIGVLAIQVKNILKLKGGFFR